MPERNTSVFDRLTVYFGASEKYLINEIVTPSLAYLVDADLQFLAQRFVCLDAFLRVIHSLDLVLTATGFGIVSTESTAPASRARVEALAEEVATQRILVIERLVIALRQQPVWPASVQAAVLIPSLFFRPTYLQSFCGMTLTQVNWQLARNRALIADGHLRRTMSNELFDDLLLKLRAASLSDDELQLVNLCMKFYAYFIPAEEPTPNSPHQAPSSFSPHARMLLDAIIEHVEAHVDLFPVYTTSRLYLARHAAGYENRPEDPTFFFM